MEVLQYTVYPRQTTIVLSYDYLTVVMRKENSFLTDYCFLMQRVTTSVKKHEQGTQCNRKCLPRICVCLLVIFNQNGWKVHAHLMDDDDKIIKRVALLFDEESSLNQCPSSSTPYRSDEILPAWK